MRIESLKKDIYAHKTVTSHVVKFIADLYFHVSGYTGEMGEKI